MYTKENIYKDLQTCFDFQNSFFWFTETLFEVIFYMRIFYKQFHYCCACTRVIPVKLQVKLGSGWSLQNLMLALRNSFQSHPQKNSGTVIIQVREQENHSMSLKSLSAICSYWILTSLHTESIVYVFVYGKYLLGCYRQRDISQKSMPFQWLQFR